MIKSAEISQCGHYRYHLLRRWRADTPLMTFIMLNPSTADDNYDDATIRRCMAFSKAGNFGGVQVINLFAFRATNPKDLKNALDPVGDDNQEYFEHAYRETETDPGLVIAAWGTHGAYLGQDETTMGWLSKFPRWDNDIWCFGTTKDCFPRHPLYLKSDTPLIRYHGRPV